MILLQLCLVTIAGSEEVTPKEVIASSSTEDAKEIVRQAVEYWRDDTSYVTAKMTVHRADWQRESELRSWTKDMTLSLVRFVAPAKDFGNATLSKDEEIWTFTPKTNRVIKIPASMKSQSWMGSDFSYQDLARDDEIVELYSHRYLGSSEQDGHRVHAIESIPLDHAPIVWGKEVQKIRDDYIILEHSFYDQDMQLVKVLRTREIGELGGKLFPLVMRMENAEEPEEWTEITHTAARFDLALSQNFFTLSNLRNPRR